MIKNDRQHRITKAQAAKFEQALKALSASEAVEAAPALLRQAERAALESQLTDLRQQIHEYDLLRSGKQKALTPRTLEELPLTLIQARIAAGWSQHDLAAQLGLKEQQIQRYEATEYASASLERVQTIARKLGVRLRPPEETASRQTKNNAT